MLIELKIYKLVPNSVCFTYDLNNYEVIYINKNLIASIYETENTFNKPCYCVYLSKSITINHTNFNIDYFLMPEVPESLLK